MSQQDSFKNKTTGQHVRWIDPDSGYSQHGSYIGEKHFFFKKSKIIIRNSEGFHYVDEDTIEWYNTLY